MDRLLVLVVFTLAVWACNSSKEKDQTGELKGNSDIAISEIHPNRAMPGTFVTIYGANFSDQSKVYIGDVEVDSVDFKSSMSLRIKVPKMAAETSRLKVTSSDSRFYSNAVSCTVLPVPGNVPAVYWTQHEIYRGIMTEDGISMELLVESAFTRGLEIDQANNVLYYGNFYGTIYKMDLDGEGKAPEVIMTLGEGLEDICLGNDQWLYYANQNSIGRVNLKDSTSHETLYAERIRPKSIEMDLENEIIYWAEADLGQIMKADINEKSEPAVLFGGENGLKRPVDFTIDKQNGAVYIADTPTFGDSRIMTGSVAGKNELEKLFHSDDGIGENILSIFVDQGNRNLYWMNSRGANNNNYADGGILRLSLDKENAQPEILFQPINHGHLVRL